MARSVIVLVRGGLCNRLRAALSGAMWAEQSGRRFAVAWPANDRFQARLDDLWHHEFRVIPFLAARCAAHLTGGFKTSEEAQSMGGRLVVVSTDEVFLLDGEKPSWWHLLDSMSPTEPVTRRIESLPARSGQVGVMIRANNPHRVTGETSPPEWFFDRMEKMRSCRPDVEFFLSTDNPRISREVHSRFAGVFEQQGKSAFNSVDGVQDAVADLYLLARCDYILGSHYSSFSETAAAMAGHERYETAAVAPPEPWI